MDQGHMFLCIETTTAGGANPSSDGGTHWQLIGDPADDMRLSATSPHAGIGLLDAVTQ